jgi:GntR family carbon starvation induced transcriptional regulator
VRIELAALDLSMQHADHAWQTRVRMSYEDFCRVKQKVGDPTPIDEAWEKRHRIFHLALVSACSSPTLLQFCAQLHDRFDRYRRLALPSRSYMGGLGDDHKEIMEAALAGRQKEALSLLTRHLEDTAALVGEYFKAPEDSCGAAKSTLARPCSSPNLRANDRL